MKSMEVAYRLFEKFEESQRNGELLQYPGILALFSAIQMAEQENDSALLERCLNYLRQFPEATKHKKYNFEAYHVGGIAAAYAFMKGYLEDEKDLMMEYAEKTMTAPRDRDGLVMAPNSSRECIWIDSIMCVTPFLLYIGLAMNEPRYIDEAVNQALGHYNVLLDRENGLLHQCRGFVADDTLTPDHWGRGNGWGFIALTELVRWLPEDYPRRKEVERVFARHAFYMRPHQSNHGMWRQEIPFEYSYEESSATGLILYGYAVGVQRNLIDRNSFMAQMQLGLNGLLTFAIDKNFNTDLCCRGCRCPGFGEDKGTLRAYILTLPKANDGHSFGTMMLAFAECARAGIENAERMEQYYYKPEWDM